MTQTTTTEDLHRWPATRLARALAARELKASALAEALIERSARLEPTLHVWAAFSAREVRRSVRLLDEKAARGPLHGLPLAVKDNIDTGGHTTAYGSKVYAGHVPHDDAACVALAREAGAWVLGKAVCTEFANFTPGLTRNPWNPQHTPGGSSSGSAAAVAAGFAPLALGTQTAGSVIRPAAFCGVVGYKPSARRIPRAGVKANSDTLDEVGLFARSVDDAGLAAAVLACDARAALPASDAFAPRIGFTLTSRAAHASPAMTAMLERTARRASAAGAAVREAGWPDGFDALFDAQRTVQLFETVRALSAESLYRHRHLSAELRELLDEGHSIDAARYRAALEAGRQAQARLSAAWFDGFDVLLAPAAPGAAPRGLANTGDPVFNRPWQLLGCPCIALPGGFDAAGLPLGLQLVGAPGEDRRLFAAAAWLERVRGPLEGRIDPLD